MAVVNPDPLGAPAGAARRARMAAEKVPTVGRWQGRSCSDPPDDPVIALQAAAAELDVAYSATIARLTRAYPGVDPYVVRTTDGRPILLDAAAARVTARAALLLASIPIRPARRRPPAVHKLAPTTETSPTGKRLCTCGDYWPHDDTRSPGSDT